jgi:hypothetical protein
MEQYLTRIGKTLKSLVASHAIPARSREVTIAFNFISERTVYIVYDTSYLYDELFCDEYVNIYSWVI